MFTHRMSATNLRPVHIALSGFFPRRWSVAFLLWASRRQPSLSNTRKPVLRDCLSETFERSRGDGQVAKVCTVGRVPVAVV